MKDDIRPEIWAWYGVGLAIILARFAVRIRTVGIPAFQGDDYMSILTLICYTLDTVTVTICYQTGQNVDITAETLPGISHEEVVRLVYGSKMQLAAWYSYTALLWTLKFTMLFFYGRLTLGSLHASMVKHLFWVCGVAYTAVLLTVTFGCWPYQLNWQVAPVPPWKCSMRVQNFIVTAVLNIITDIALLVIPIPMMWRLKVPLRKKVVISILLSSGVFIITAAVIRVVYTLAAEPSGSNINRWGTRETIIGIAAVNIPILRPLFTGRFWTWGAYDPSAPASSLDGSRTWKPKRLGESASERTDIELGTSAAVTGRTSTSSSQENIRDWDQKDSNVVFVQTTYDIRSHTSDDDSSLRRHEGGWKVHPSTTIT